MKRLCGSLVRWVKNCWRFLKVGWIMLFIVLGWCVFGGWFVSWLVMGILMLMVCMLMFLVIGCCSMILLMCGISFWIWCCFRLFGRWWVSVWFWVGCKWWGSGNVFWFISYLSVCRLMFYLLSSWLLSII